MRLYRMRMQKVSAPISFQSIQIVSDLRSVVATGFGGLAERMNPAHKPLLRKIIFDQKCVLSVKDAQSIHSDLLLVAAMPDKGLDSFLTATALLLADRLQGGAGEDDLYWNWDAFQEQYRLGSSPTRAALMNAFRWAHITKRVNLDKVPEGRDLQTYDVSDLVRILKHVARSMPRESRDIVCEAGPRETRDVHRKALENCLAGSCILSEYGGWFPGEVVENASLDPRHVAYSECTALVLLDAIETRDAQGRMAFRWEEQSGHYLQMKSDLGTTILAGIRHLHEMAMEWKPYSGWSADALVEKAVVVPFPKA